MWLTNRRMTSNQGCFHRHWVGPKRKAWRRFWGCWTSTSTRGCRETSRNLKQKQKYFYKLLGKFYTWSHLQERCNTDATASAQEWRHWETTPFCFRAGGCSAVRWAQTASLRLSLATIVSTASSWRRWNISIYFMTSSFWGKPSEWDSRFEVVDL